MAESLQTFIKFSNDKITLFNEYANQKLIGIFLGSVASENPKDYKWFVMSEYLCKA